MSTEMIHSSYEPVSQNDFTNGKVQPTRNVEWYQPVLNTLPETARRVFRDYSGVPEDGILDHIYQVRDKAWDILPYPCIGVFRFLDFGMALNLIYPQVLERVRAGEVLLDLGCCFGQDIRKLVADGAPSDKILGVDIEHRFFELGYELFRDKETLQAQFYMQSIFEEGFLTEWEGKVDMIYVGSFLHLFDLDQQRIIVKQMAKLLRKTKGSLVFGRNLGAEKGGKFKMESIGWDLYRHSHETIKLLWDEAPEGPWEVSDHLTRYESEGWDQSRRSWQGNETQQMTFVATRI